MSIGSLLIQVLNIFVLFLFIRLILDYVRLFKPGWRPRGVILPVAEIIYTVTDKPLGFVRKFVPPLRLGAVALDLSFIVLFFGIQWLLIPLIRALPI
ncbi:MAG: YggT family protein [Actinobacteria bacterium]|jgi:YggT family protein|nr:YggT family protein [Actinomycetota bacterium]MDA2984707.1 YggT family protein [Actinomycetota bacterium]